MNNDETGFTCLLCGFESFEIMEFDRHFYDVHGLEWEMAELERGHN